MIDDKTMEAVRLAIANCKAEIDNLVGESVIQQMDDGSPWGRAFLKTCSQLKEYYASQTTADAQRNSPQ